MLRELCRLLLLAADSVKDSAVPAKSEACTGLEATAAAAAGKAMQAKPNGTGTKPDDRSAHGKPSAMYEMQEACVLQVLFPPLPFLHNPPSLLVDCYSFPLPRTSSRAVVS